MVGIAVFWWVVMAYGLASVWVAVDQLRGAPGRGATALWWLVASGLAAQGYLLTNQLLAGDGALTFDLATSLSLLVLVLALLCLLGWRIRPQEMGTVNIFLLPMMVGLLLASHWLPAGHTSPRELIDDPLFAVHLLLSLLAYGMFSIAVILGIFDLVQERALRRKRFGRMFALLPALGAVEEIMFAMVRVGFALLTLSILTGSFYAHRQHGAYFLWNHKVIFTWATWFIFGALLVGRSRDGWRGARAVRFVLFGYLTLMLAFLGVKVVSDLILRR